MERLESTFSYIVDFRGGTYCTQVKAEDLQKSLQAWLDSIKKEKTKIQHLGEKTLEEIATILEDEDYQPVLLRGLKNIWFMHVPTKKGSLSVNIVLTDVS
jgi:hypothetical protein